jgi:hypothetical protein
MKLHIGGIPNDPDFDPEAEGWHSFDEPGPWAIQLVTIPIALMVAIFLMVCFNAVIPQAIYRSKLLLLVFELWQPFLAIIVLVPLHEFIHALCYPRTGKDDDILIGIWPQKVLVYAFFKGTMTRQRFTFTMITPFLVLSFVPVLIVAASHNLPKNPQIMTFLVVLSILNGIASCGDILGVALALWRIPRTAIIRNQGWKSYWKNGQISESSIPTSSSSSP